jgi:hypothetical protein
MFACLFSKHIRNQALPCKPDQTDFSSQSINPSPGIPGGVFTGSVCQMQKQQSPHEEGFVVCKESDACPEFIEGMTYFGSDITSMKPI